MYQQAFDQLITEIHKDLTENRQAFYISSLLERFKSLLRDDVSSEGYKRSKIPYLLSPTERIILAGYLLMF